MFTHTHDDCPVFYLTLTTTLLACMSVRAWRVAVRRWLVQVRLRAQFVAASGGQSGRRSRTGRALIDRNQSTLLAHVLLLGSPTRRRRCAQGATQPVAPPAKNSHVHLNQLLQLLALRADSFPSKGRSQLRFRRSIPERKIHLHADAEIAVAIRTQIQRR